MTSLGRSRATPAQGYEVDPDALRQHAASLEAIKDRFAALAEASASVTEMNGAFGLMFGDWMEPLLTDKHDEVQPLIPDLADAVDSHVQALRECADSYEAADADAASELDKLEGGLDG